MGINTLQYADDTTFFNVSSDFQILTTETDDTLSQAAIWFISNGFLLNGGKTQHVYFSLRDIPV